MACKTTTALYLGVSTTICADGGASRSGNTVTVSGTFSYSQSGSWNIDALWARIVGYTGWVQVKPRGGGGGSYSANWSFTMNTNQAGNTTFTAEFSYFNTANTQPIGGTDTIGVPASWPNNIWQPADPTVTLVSSSASALNWRFHESNWGNNPGRWRYYVTTEDSFSDADTTRLPASGSTSAASMDSGRTGLTSNRAYWTWVNVSNGVYSNPGGNIKNKWGTRPAQPSFTLTNNTNLKQDFLPYPYSKRAPRPYGITFTTNANGSVTLNGKNDNAGQSKFYFFSEEEAGEPNLVLEPGTYTFSSPPNGNIYYTIYDGTNYKSVKNSDNYTFTITARTTYKMMSIDVGKGTTTQFNNVNWLPRLTKNTDTQAKYTINWSQFTGDADYQLKVQYRIEEGDNATPIGTTWTDMSTIAAGSGNANQTKTGTQALTGLKLGQTYTVFVRSTNATGGNDGTGPSEIYRRVITTPFPPQPQLKYRWNDTRDELTIYMLASELATSAQASWGYDANANTLVPNINGKGDTSEVVVKYPTHNSNNIIYIKTRNNVDGRLSGWYTPIQINVPHPIIGIAIYPNGTKRNIIDIVEKKVGGTVTAKWQSGQRIVKK